MYMLPRDNHCITPTPSCGTSSNVVPAANPDWLNPVRDGLSNSFEPYLPRSSSSTSSSTSSTSSSTSSSSSSVPLQGPPPHSSSNRSIMSKTPMTTHSTEVTPTPSTSLEALSSFGSVPGDVSLLYRRLGRHLSLPIQNFVPKRECPECDEHDDDDDDEMSDVARAAPKMRGKWKAIPAASSHPSPPALPAPVSEEKQRNDADDCKRAEMLTYEKAAAEWESALLGTPNLLPTPNGVKQLIDLGVPAHHCSVEDAVEDSENAHQGCSEADAYLVDSLFLGPTPCPRKRPKFTYDHISASACAAASQSRAEAAARAARAATEAAARATAAMAAAAAVSTMTTACFDMRLPASRPAAPLLGLSSPAPMTPFITSPAVVKASPWSIASMTPHRSHHSDFLF